MKSLLLCLLFVVTIVQCRISPCQNEAYPFGNILVPQVATEHHGVQFDVAYNSLRDEHLLVYFQADPVRNATALKGKRVKDPTDPERYGEFEVFATPYPVMFPTAVYNPQSNEYMVAFIADTENVNRAYTVYAAKLSSTGSYVNYFPVGPISRADDYVELLWNPVTNLYVVAFHTLLANQSSLDMMVYLINSTGVESSFAVGTLQEDRQPRGAFNSDNSQFLITFEMVTPGSGSANDTTLSDIAGVLFDSHFNLIRPQAYVVASFVYPNGNPIPASDPQVAYSSASSAFILAAELQLDSSAGGPEAAVIVRQIRDDGFAVPGFKVLGGDTGNTCHAPRLSGDGEDRYLVVFENRGEAGQVGSVRGELMSGSTELLSAFDAGTAETNPICSYNSEVKNFFVLWTHGEITPPNPQTKRSRPSVEEILPSTKRNSVEVSMKKMRTGFARVEDLILSSANPAVVTLSETRVEKRQPPSLTQELQGASYCFLPNSPTREPKLGPIIGGVIGGVVGLIILIVIIVFVVRALKKKSFSRFNDQE